MTYEKCLNPLFLILSAFLSTYAYAMPSHQLIEDLNKVLSSNSPSPWQHLPKSNLRFIVVDASTNQGTAIGYSQAELQASGIKYEFSNNGSTLTGLKFPEIDFFTACDFISCGENQAWNENDRGSIAPIVTLFNSSRHPILLISSELSGDWATVPALMGVTEEQVLLITALHESFHSYQNLISLHAQSGSRPESTRCFGTNDSNVDPLVVSDMANWNAVLKTLFFKPSDFMSMLQKAVSFNASKNDACLKTAWFLQEAVPQYFSLGLISDAGIFSKKQIYHYYSSLWLEKPDYSSLNYGIGLVMMQSLAHLDPALTWQKNLEDGEMIDQVLQNYLVR